MKGEYLDRIVDGVLEEYLGSFGAVLIEGAKWCGKTRTARERAASEVLLHDPRLRNQYLEMAGIAPEVLLSGDTPRLIDEWQTAPGIWDGVRFEVDRRGETGQFILTGSAQPAEGSVMHSGTGRIARLLMRPMSLFESGESDGSVSLRSLYAGEDISGESRLPLEGLARALVRGGWPAAVVSGGGNASIVADRYVRSIVRSDIPGTDDVDRDPGRMELVMRSVARNTATMAGMKALRKDMEREGEVSEKTIASYIRALKRAFVIEELPAWTPAIRSRINQRTASKHHFVDPSLAAAVLRASPQDLIWDLRTFGLLFESLCIRDLRVYSQATDGEVRHYHDGSGLEVDAIVRRHCGQWGAVEVRMNTADIDGAAANLIKLRDKIDTDEVRSPSFLMVLTSMGFAYRRGDGVYVVPIGCLRD